MDRIEPWTLAASVRARNTTAAATSATLLIRPDGSRARTDAIASAYSSPRSVAIGPGATVLTRPHWAVLGYHALVSWQNTSPWWRRITPNRSHRRRPAIEPMLTVRRRHAAPSRGQQSGQQERRDDADAERGGDLFGGDVGGRCGLNQCGDVVHENVESSAYAFGGRRRQISDRIGTGGEVHRNESETGLSFDPAHDLVPTISGSAGNDHVRTGGNASSGTPAPSPRWDPVTSAVRPIRVLSVVIVFPSVGGSVIAEAKASGASWGTLRPMPSSRRCWYQPVYRSR